MMRGTIRQTIGAAALAALLPLLCVSCSEDGISTASVGGGDDGNTVTMGVTFRVSEGYYLEGYYEPGTEYENYIDIKGGDYRIYFFDATDNTLIAKFNPESLLAVDGSNYTEYTMLGEVPDELIAKGENTSFKIVMLANWGSYEDDGFDEKTTIGDICDADWAVFPHLTDFNLSPTNLIPFYGVHTYTDVTFKANDATILDEPITLLRAMAKVEVLLDNKIATFTDVDIHRYNNQGYCAPEKVYSEDEYDHKHYYDDDYADGVHLTNSGNNDDDTAERTLPFLKTKDRIIDDNSGDITQYETWIAYLPEYDNTTDTDDYSYITVKLNYQASNAEPYTIYFADYGEDGTTDNSDRYDIQRNNLYRFTVSLSNNFVRIIVTKWDEVYENDFDFIASSSDD